MNMQLQNTTFGILVEQMYEDLELWYPYYRLQEAGARVITIGPAADTKYASKHGYPCRTERAAADIRADELDGLVIPGGFAPDHMRRHREMVDLVANCVQQNKLVCAICHAGWMLCSAKVLDGRRATSFHSIKDDMINAGCQWVDEEVVRDGNLITSRSPNDLPAFCRTMIEAAATVPA